MHVMVLMHKSSHFVACTQARTGSQSRCDSHKSNVTDAPVQQLWGYAEDNAVTNMANKFLRE